MPVFMCRWPNGDFSFVSAANKQEAMETLDEIDNAEACPLSVVRDLMVHFRLEEDGTFELEGFGEVTEEMIWKEYPVLDKTLDHVFGKVKGEHLTREDMQVIGEAVSKERGREIKKSAMERLKEFKPKGKPN